MLSLESLLTSGGVWWPELERVAQHVVVIPDIQLVVSRVVVHRGYILVGVRKSDVDRLLTRTIGVVGIHHQISACFAVIVLVD